MSQQEFARLWEPVPDVELFEARLYRHRFGKHFHAAYTIGLNEAGQGRCQHGRSYRSHYPGGFNLLNPGDLHTGQVASPEGWAFRNLYIGLPMLERVLAQMEWRGSIPCFGDPVVRDSSLRSLFYQLFRALDSGPRLAQQSLLLEFLSRLFHRYAVPCPLEPPKPESKAVATARAYLEAHYADDVSIDELARLVHLSPHYLIRSFHRQVGCPPHQYQQHWQLQQVKRSLHSPTSLAALAAEHGFYDQSHLSRAFKRTFGVTPGQYQRQH